MRIKALLVLVGVCCLGTLSGQTLFPRKTLAFAQIAVGGVFETFVTLTNRGTAEYSGTAFLYRNEGDPWNPTVNGEAVSDGRFAVALAAGETATFRLTGAELDEGFLILIPANFVQDNFVEGNLTYQVRRGGALADSVGILPSAEFLLASIPFESFSSVALSLINPDVVDDVDANVTLALFDESGAGVAEMEMALPTLFHDPTFLGELFVGVNLQRGRVDIRSDRPIFGTALTLTEGQLSALPLSGAVRSYTVQLTSAAGTSTGGASLWADSFFVNGYLVIDAVDGDDVAPVTYLLFGRLVRGVLRLSSYGAGPTFGDREVSIYAQVDEFDLQADEVATSYIATDLEDQTTTTGMLTLTRGN